MSYGKIIFGDNQFIGVNHADQSKASSLNDRFRKVDQIISILGVAYDCGIRDFMFTTHDRYDEVFSEIARSKLFPGMFYTPCIPYAHKYWNKLSDGGYLHLLKTSLKPVSKSLILSSFPKLLFGRSYDVIQLFLEIEIILYKGLPLRGIFIQNLLFDLLNCFELYGIIEDFTRVVQDRYNCLPGFITMNHSESLDILCNKVGLEMPWICANYNKAGFRMHPDQVSTQASFESRRSHNIAMSVLASGNLDPVESFEFVADSLNNGNIESVLFGSSNPDNIKKNVSFINNKCRY